MEYALYGALGAVLALLLFGGGITLGLKIKRRQRPQLTPEDVEGLAERQRLLNDQNAFRSLMNYSQEQAYGMGAPVSTKEEGEA